MLHGVVLFSLAGFCIFLLVVYIPPLLTSYIFLFTFLYFHISPIFFCIYYHGLG